MAMANDSTEWSMGEIHFPLCGGCRRGIFLHPGETYNFFIIPFRISVTDTLTLPTVVVKIMARQDSMN